MNIFKKKTVNQEENKRERISKQYERRRGLEWLISKEEDWYNISLDT